MRYARLLCLSLLLAVPASAQITLDRVVVGTPGATLSNGPMQMNLTLGQTAVGPTLGGTIKTDLGFWWQVVSITTDVNHNVIPTEFALHGTAPNPFSTRTQITYAIPRGPVPVFLGIFNLQGGLVRTLVSESQSPGTFTVTWDGCDAHGQYLPAGVYFTKFTAGTFQRTAKTVMLK